MIEQLRVRNYKSLEDVTIKLRPLNIFVGPNNSGKSNILDCFQFLADFVQGAGAVHSRGGFGTLVWGGDLKRAISIELEGKLSVKRYKISTRVEGLGPPKGKSVPYSIPYRYELQLAGGPTHYQLIKEIFSIKQDQRVQRILEFPSSNDPKTGQIWDEEGSLVLNVGYSPESYIKYVLQDPKHYPSTLQMFAMSLSSWRSYHLIPSRMRYPLPVKKDLQLQPEGENLSTVLLSLQSEYHDDFKKIVETLRAGVPELRELYTAITGEGSTYINIEEQGLDQRIPAWAMSDGTLQLLAYLAVLYSPTPPSLACFEEPENFLHPHLLQLLADLLKEASERTQILVATHSPYLLNFMDPVDLVIVEKSEGKTKVRPAHKKKGLKEALRVLGLGEMWYAGSLGGIPQ